MPKMSESTLQASLAAQHMDALAAVSSSKLSGDRAKALAYYNGDMSGDMPAPAGRSQAVSMDVADTVEGILPQLIEVFAGTDEVVKFEPVGPEDVQAAEQETDYINHVFMNQNNGFLVLYSFIKDALLSKVGVAKVWWEEEEREEKETYLDKTDDEYALIISDPDVEVAEHSEHGPEDSDSGTDNSGGDYGGGAVPQLGMGQPPAAPALTLHDVTVVRKKKYASAKVLGVPPEEFGIERNARTIKDCNYCFHKVVDRTEADLIAMGYDAKQVKTLPSYRSWTNQEEVNRDTVDENTAPGSSDANSGTRNVEITEHYVRLDYENNGKVCLYKVVTGGTQGVILKKDGKPDIEEFDAIPFAAITPVIVTHRFYGKSLADLVMDIQRIKTALLRGGLDSIYIALNPRVVVSEQGASDNTLDDLLVSRPQQIVRVKGDANSSIAYQVSPDMTKSAFPALEYLDTIKETRTGVSKRGQGIEPDALANQSATAAQIVDNASQARVRLIARIFAETGIRDLFWLLHATIKKHGQQAEVVRLRNNWVTVDPRNWKNRDDLTVHVGLGTGNRAMQMAETQMLVTAQTQAIGAGLVSKRNLFNTAKKLVKVLGEKDAETYFVDPGKQPQGNDPASAPIPPPADPKMAELQFKGQQQQQQAMLDQQAAQSKAQIEQVQAQADIATQDRKTQAEMTLAAQKAQLEAQLMQAEHQMKMAQLSMQAELHRQKLDHQEQLHQHAMRQAEFSVMAARETHQQKLEQAKARPAAGA